MWCGPIAVARILGKRSGWTKERVWLHIRALREQEGARLTVDPVGGTYLRELTATLERAGLVVAPRFLPGHTTVAQLRLQQHRRRRNERHFYVVKGDRCIGKCRGYWRDIGALVVQRRKEIA
jgi:NADPH:quinone reductase-like Zn-dependent oxidoreductase